MKTEKKPFDLVKLKGWLTTGTTTGIDAADSFTSEPSEFYHDTYHATLFIKGMKELVKEDAKRLDMQKELKKILNGGRTQMNELYEGDELRAPDKIFDVNLRIEITDKMTGNRVFSDISVAGSDMTTVDRVVLGNSLNRQVSKAVVEALERLGYLGFTDREREETILKTRRPLDV